MKRIFAATGAGLAAAVFLASAVAAAEITIGLGADVTSMDPHYHTLSPNNNIATHVFGTLIDQDEMQKLKPGLAESWRIIDDSTWEFKLRRGVKFHDGSDFTADDVVATLARVPAVPNSPAAFTIYTKSIAGVSVVDPHTMIVKTAGPYPLLPTDLSNIFIISQKQAKAATEDFNAGKAMNGTGPFKFASWARGDRINLVRNDGYWGPKPAWDKVTFKLITNDPSRVAALLAGDLNAIEIVPTADMAKLKTNKDINIFRVVSNRIIFFHLDTDRDVSPFVTDKQGKPLDRNPLKDLRVRKALSKALNRPGIVDRVMEGEAIPAGQLLPDGFYGTSPNLKPEAYDVEGARKLLAEAGYPQGFAITIHGPNNRYVNDEKIVQAAAQMFARIGVDAKVETMPSNVFFTRANKLEFSFMLVGWGSGTGEVSSPLRSLLATFDAARGMGTANRGRYSNKQMDALLDQALATVDDAKREKLLQQASEVAINNLGIIPLHYQVNSWATRKGVMYVPRTDENTLALEFKPRS
ncbi:MAG: ABC transporter substrate-binding protein [Alphaproteobacteria bacterium]|nr:ABC transporter substrate-binding protein [Alphaproteobacteria bacterium]